MKGFGTSPPSVGERTSIASRSLSVGAAVGFTGQLVTIGGGLVGQIIVVRHIGAADYGAYALATTLTYLFAVLVRFGLHGLAVRMIAQAIASGRDGVRELTRGIVRLSVFVSVIALPILGFVALPFSNFLFLSGRLTTVEIWVLATTVMAEAVRYVQSECFRGFNRQAASAALGNAGRTFVFVTLIVAMVMVDESPMLVAVLLVALAASVATALITSVCLSVWVSTRVPAADDVPPAPRVLLRQGSPFMLTELCSFGLVMGDVLVVGLFSNETDTALYATASRAASMLTVPTYVLVGLLSPLIAALWSQRRPAELQRQLTKSITVTSVLCAVGLAIILLFGGWILAFLFGDPFEQAGPILAILAVGAAANVFFGQGFQLLMLCGRARLATMGNAVFGIGTVLAELGAGALWGITGVAVASASGLALQQLTLAMIARSVLGLKAYPFAGLIAMTRRDRRA